MPLLVFSIIVALVKRAKPVTVALFVYEAWRRLPPEHRQRVWGVARRNGPRLASSLARRARPRS
jgi:hypothetical protein